MEVVVSLVGTAVFKTVEPYGKHAVGGFDSHALPPFSNVPFRPDRLSAFSAGCSVWKNIDSVNIKRGPTQELKWNIAVFVNRRFFVNRWSAIR